PRPGVRGRRARRGRDEARARRAAHGPPHRGDGRGRGLQPRARDARQCAAGGSRARSGREPATQRRQRRHDRAGGVVAPRAGRAERLDAGRPRGPAVAGARTLPCHSPIRKPQSAIAMTIYPLVLHLGPLNLTGYGIMMMVAFLMAGWTIQLDLRQRGLDEEYAADIVIAAVVGGLVGAKLWYVVVSGDWDAVFRRGGFVWYGGFLGGVAAVLLNGRRLHVPSRYTMELTAAALPVWPRRRARGGGGVLHRGRAGDGRRLLRGDVAGAGDQRAGGAGRGGGEGAGFGARPPSAPPARWSPAPATAARRSGRPSP